MNYKHISLIVLLLSGCASRDFDSHKYVSIEHQKSTEFEEDSELSFPSYKIIRAIVSAGNTPSPTVVNNYFSEGLMLTRTHCLDSVLAVVKQSNDSSYRKDQFLIGSVLVTGLMGINGASSDSFEKLALGTAFLVSTSDLYQNYYLMGPDAGNVLALLEKALEAQFIFATSSAPANFVEASNRIYDYATVCSSPKIDQMVTEAMSAAEFKVPEQKSHEFNLIQAVSKELGGVLITKNNLYGLYYVIENANSIVSQGKVTTYIAGLTYANKLNELQKIFYMQPQKIRDALDSGSKILAAGTVVPSNKLLNMPFKKGSTVSVIRN
jgi:hypothetical protein